MKVFAHELFEGNLGTLTINWTVLNINTTRWHIGMETTRLCGVQELLKTRYHDKTILY